MYERLKKICKERGLNITKLCEEVTNSSGNLSTWKKGYMRSDYLSLVADRLQCSTDYILGRTDIQNKNTEINVKDNNQNNINGNNNIQVSTNNEFENEIISIFSSLTTRQRTELMMEIYKYLDKHKKISSTAETIDE